MTETRQRGTDKGDVVTEELRDGVWHVVADVYFYGTATVVTAAPEAPKPRRGRPPKAAA